MMQQPGSAATASPAWSARFGRALGLLDPALTARLALDRLWQEVRSWDDGILGLWFHARPGHLAPSGMACAGSAIAGADEVGAGPVTGPVLGLEVPAMARQVRDGNVTIATVVVAHRDHPDAAAFLVDVIARWCTDRLRMQLSASELAEENHLLRQSLQPKLGEHDILTVSGTMRALIRSAANAAASSATVLIQGETGSGKEMLARLIHSHSHRSHRPLVAVNIAALSPSLVESELFGHVRGAFTGADQDRKGIFEVADGGTLFLDEVGEMGHETQVRLLRVLQERCITRVGEHRTIPVDVRIIAATHRDLAAEVESGRFREDLFYRLNVVNLHLPPLRRRVEDIPLLVNHFLQVYNRANFKHVEEVPLHVLEMLCAYPWPGNIRELENCVQKAVVLATGTVFPEELVPPTIRSYAAGHHPPASLQAPEPRPAAPADPEAELRRLLAGQCERLGGGIAAVMDHVERLVLAWALEREDGVKVRAAKRLGINRVTLDRKLEAHRLAWRRAAGGVEDLPGG